MLHDLSNKGSERCFGRGADLLTGPRVKHLVPCYMKDSDIPLKRVKISVMPHFYNSSITMMAITAQVILC